MKLKVSKFKKHNTTFAIQIIKKQPPGVPQKKCSQKFRNTHGKTSALESLRNKLEALRRATLSKKDSRTGLHCN